MSFSPISVSDYHPNERMVSRRRHPFNDSRLFKQWQRLSEAQEATGSVVVSQLAANGAEAAGFYRFLRNDSVDMKELLSMTCRISSEHLAGIDVLSIGDTTNFNLNKHQGRIQDVEQFGVVDDNKSLGFFSHVHLAVNAATKDILGLADVLLWSRPKSQGKRRLKKWQDRESYKWALGASNAKKVLSAARTVTHLLDRDADSYELFKSIIAQQDYFVVRLHHNRQVRWQGQSVPLSHCLEQSPVLGSYQIALNPLNHYSSTSGKRVYRQARTATIEVRACAVKFPVPLLQTHLPEASLDLWVVQAKEIQGGEQVDTAPVEWIIATNHPCETFEQAKQIIEYYELRWMIEQLFRTMKSEGFDLEATELETHDAILRQTILTYRAACRVLQLVYARDRFDAQPIAEVFTPQEQKVLKKVNERYEGKTEKQQNPYPPNQTSWATWIIARLGGWKGYRSQRPPGPITLKRGLDKFEIFVEAYNLFDSS